MSTIAQWNQVTAVVEQLSAEKQTALVALVQAWLDAALTLPVAPTGHRRAGSAAGQFVVPPEFDDPLPEEIQAAFEGRR